MEIHFAQMKEKESIKKGKRAHDPDQCRDIYLISIAEFCNSSTSEISFSSDRTYFNHW